MDNKEQITTRTYKIKAIVIGILAVMVYIASQYVMFCNLPILESTGERVETDFLKWVINRNIGCIVLGIILMLIPYEWLADKFIKSHEKKLKKSASYRICTIIGAGILLPIVAALLAIAIPTGHPDMAIICCAGSVIALGVFVFPLFENKINYQGYLALVSFISMALVYVLTLYQKPEYTNDFYRFQMPEDRLQYLFILLIFLSIIIAAFVQCITKKEGSLKYNILVFIWIAIIAIFCWAIVFNLLGMAGEDGFTLKRHSLYMQYMDSGMSAFQSYSFMILLGMLAVNIVFSAVAVKCTSKYSASRVNILRWVTIMFVMLTVWQIGVGCTKPYDRYVIDLFADELSDGECDFDYLEEQFPQQVKVAKIGAAEELLSSLYDTMISRSEGLVPSTERIFLMFFGINRARKLRNGGMYDTDSNDEMSALEKLLKILKNGPKNGINSILWGESYRSIELMLGDSFDALFGKRIAYGLDSDIMDFLVAETDTKSLNGQTAVYMDVNTDVKNTHFRPYDIPAKVCQTIIWYLSNERNVRGMPKINIDGRYPCKANWVILKFKKMV